MINIIIKPSTKPDKKYMATYENDTGRTKTTHFGASGMDDYTKTHDKAQRDRYRSRHAKDLQTGDPTRAGLLSYYLLWGESTSLQANIAAYRKRFNL
jgi:hypothetical protein